MSFMETGKARLIGRRSAQYKSSPSPPPFLSSFFGFSAIRASLVSSRVETLAAFCRARPRHLGRVDDARLHEVLELAGGRVVAHVPLQLRRPSRR